MENMMNGFHNDNFDKSFDGTLIREAITYLKSKSLIKNKDEKAVNSTFNDAVNKKGEWISELYNKQNSQKALYNKFLDMIREYLSESEPQESE